VVVQLGEQHDGALCEVLVHEGHVDVVNEIDQQIFLRRALDVSYALVHIRHYHPL